MRSLVPAATCLACFSAHTVEAERLPVHRYTIADGLVGDTVNCIVQDSRGFLWICTETGLSRFDGDRFRAYGSEDGLPHPVVNDLLEARDGTVWVATAGGLAGLNNSRRPGEPAFTAFSIGAEEQADFVEVLFEDRAGRLWIATGASLYLMEARGDTPTFRRVPLAPHLPDRYPMAIHALAEDAEGSLWIASNWGLVRRLPDGRLVRYLIRAPTPEAVYDLLGDRHGQMWISWAHRHPETGDLSAGLLRFRPEPADRARASDRPLLAETSRDRRRCDQLAVSLQLGEACTMPLPERVTEIRHLVRAADGRVLATSSAGLLALDEGNPTLWGEKNGLPSQRLRALAEDSTGNLWLGTEDAGLVKIVRVGLRTYTSDDGLGGAHIISFVEAGGEPLHVTGWNGTKRFISALMEDRFTTIPIPIPPSIRSLGWGWNQFLVRDRARAWWVPTAQGLLRFPPTLTLDALAHAQPIARYLAADGVPLGEIFRLYEDRHGDIWIGAFAPPRLFRWTRQNERIRAYTPADGFTAGQTPTAFAEDAAGNLWMGLFYDGLVRYAGERFEHFTHSDGVPRHFINDLHVDRRGRLWVAASRDGLARIDAPTAARPEFVRYTTADGLSSNGITALAEDAAGRMYLGTHRGVDRLDPATGRIEHFTTREGLAHNNVVVAHTDRRGDIWFGTLGGISRLDPEQSAPSSAPAVLISGLRVGGEPHPVSELGVSALDELQLGSHQRQIDLEFVGISFGPGERVSYQHRLVGVSDEWSAPSDDRTVRFVRLSPGAYRFEVRAVSSVGATSPAAATVTFSIATPIAQRWWFLGGLLAIAIAAAAWWHRQRVHRLVEIERVRTRIATDLHDDLGARLSRISILAEAARRQLDGSAPAATQLMTDVGETARELIESTADIAWSIDPNQDDLGSLIARIRRFASDVLDGREIAWSFITPPEGDASKLSPEARRHVLLIVQEAINNVVRHSHANHVALSLVRDDGHLVLEVRDDGVGFDANDRCAPPAHGRGLRNIEARARALGGTLAIHTKRGGGTAVCLSVPL